jgi:hypothetical protein
MAMGKSKPEPSFLYSRQANAGSKKFEVIVGYGEKVPWKMIDTPPSLLGAVDAKLKDEADKLAASLPIQNTAVQGSRTDGFEIVDAETGQVANWGPWLPIFLPKEKALPKPGCEFYVHDGDLYLVQTDTNGRLLAISLVPVGGLWWIAILLGFAFLSGSLIAHALSRRFLRSYFALRGIRLPTLEEALRNGEGQNIEFKRGLSDDETKSGESETDLLKSIAAFANTNDGVIFIGIDDLGHVRGLGLSFKQRDRLEQKIRQLIRNRVNPAPPIQVTFEDVRGLVIAKISVPRGEGPGYMIGGVIHVRHGSSDVQAQSDDLKRLFDDYAS